MHRRSQILTVFASLVLLATIGLAQNSKHTTTNKDVIDMVKAQLSVDLIVKQIQTAPLVDFDVSPQALIELKNAGVDARISFAMLDRSTKLDAPDKTEGDKDQPRKKRVQASSFTIEFDFCKTSVDTITCEVVVRSREDAKSLNFGFGNFTPTMFDDSGIEHRAAESSLAGRHGRENFLPMSKDQEARGKIIFVNVKPKPKLIKMLRLYFTAFTTPDTSSPYHRNEDFKVEFRDIPLL